MPAVSPAAPEGPPRAVACRPGICSHSVPESVWHGSRKHRPRHGSTTREWRDDRGSATTGRSQFRPAAFGWSRSVRRPEYRRPTGQDPDRDRHRRCLDTAEHASPNTHRRRWSSTPASVGGPPGVIGYTQLAGPLTEEFGWRGYLRQRWGRVRTTATPAVACGPRCGALPPDASVGQHAAVRTVAAYDPAQHVAAPRVPPAARLPADNQGGQGLDRAAPRPPGDAAAGRHLTGQKP
jgi:hypothetical protein